MKFYNHYNNKTSFGYIFEDILINLFIHSFIKFDIRNILNYYLIIMKNYKMLKFIKTKQNFEDI